MADFGENLRRIMAGQGLDVDDVVRCSGLDARTVKGILAGATQPHARTLHQLAAGLGVSADELFQDPALLAWRSFDRQTNPLVDALVAARPELFAGWSLADFDELYSRVGAGGAMTAEGAAQAAEQMNAHREVHRKVALLLESSQHELLTDLVELLYEKVVVRE